MSQKAGVADPTSKSLGHRRPRLRRRRLARPLRRQRHAAEQAVSQQPERHVHRGGRRGRRGLQRGRRRARRDGRRRRRLRPLRPPAPARRQLLEPDARRSITTRATAVRRRGADVHGRPRQPAVARVRRLLLRLRPRRPARHLRRQRPHRGGDRARAAEGAVQGAAAAVPQPGQGQVRAASSASLGPAFKRAAGRRAARPTPTTTRTATSTSCITNNHGPARLLRNDGGNQQQLDLRRRPSARSRTASGIGAVVRVQSASGKQWSTVRSGSSYCSQSDLALTFGLGRRHRRCRRSTSSGRAAPRTASPTCRRTSSW